MDGGVFHDQATPLHLATVVCIHPKLILQLGPVSWVHGYADFLQLTAIEEVVDGKGTRRLGRSACRRYKRPYEGLKQALGGHNRLLEDLLSLWRPRAAAAWNQRNQIPWTPLSAPELSPFR